MIATGKLISRSLLLSVILLLGFDHVCAQVQPAQPQPAQPSVGSIHGIVKSGNMPIPGAEVLISTAASDQKISTWTDVDGTYSASVPAYGSYTVRVQMVAFSNYTARLSDSFYSAEHGDAGFQRQFNR